MLDSLFIFFVPSHRRNRLDSFSKMVISIIAIGTIGLCLIACSADDEIVDSTNTIVATQSDVSLPETAQSALMTTTSATPTVVTSIVTPTETPIPKPLTFNGDRAYDFLLTQMDFGPRWPGSPGHQAVGDYIAGELERMGWDVEEQKFDVMGLEARNIIGRANIGAGPVIMIGAHYDTRKLANRTPESQEPVPGAVDGASGVAVLLELARVLDLDQIDREIWLTFFDVEDNGSGGMPGFDWIVGSTYMAENLTIIPEAMILVDMVGDADQQLYYEGNSDPELSAAIWGIAAELGYEQNFIPELKHTMIDDHLPFATIGIAAVDIIDFDYPYWHTVEDTADKASADSLMRVGRTLETWLETRLDK